MSAHYQSQRDPKPAPGPTCQHNCGPVPVQGLDWRCWTCRCGYGYFRTDDSSWVSGNHVRNGNAPPRDEQHTSSRSNLYPPCPDCVSPKAVRNAAGATDSDPRSTWSPHLQPQSLLGGPQHDPWGNDDILSTNSRSPPRPENYTLNRVGPMPPQLQEQTQFAQTPSYQAGLDTTRNEGYHPVQQDTTYSTSSPYWGLSYAPSRDTEASEPVSTYPPLAPETGYIRSTSPRDYLDHQSSYSTSSHVPDDLPQSSPSYPALPQYHQQESQTPSSALPPTGPTYGPRPIVHDDLPSQEDRRRRDSSKSARKAYASGADKEDARLRMFCPGKGISFEVIEGYIQKRLGPDATVERGDYNGSQGYIIHARRRLTEENISDLKRDSLEFETNRLSITTEVNRTQGSRPTPGSRYHTRGERRDPTTSRVTNSDSGTIRSTGKKYTTSRSARRDSETERDDGRDYTTSRNTRRDSETERDDERDYTTSRNTRRDSETGRKPDAKRKDPRKRH